MVTVMWHAAGLFLLLVMMGCGQERRSPPTAPTVPNLPVIPDVPVTPTPTFTLSGVVTERFSGRPVPGAKVWVEPFSISRVGRWPPTGMQETPSDEAGRYRISGLPSLGTAWVSTANTWGPDPPYVHQCVTMVTVEGDTTFNVTVASTADLVALNASTPTPPNSRSVSGTVFEITEKGRQPLKNILVWWEGSGSGNAFAETVTDAAGHYRLCGLPKDRISLGAAPAYAKVFYAPLDPGSDAVLDIEVKR